MTKRELEPGEHGKITSGMKFGLLIILAVWVLIGLVFLIFANTGSAERPTEEEQIQQLIPVVDKSIAYIDTIGVHGTGFYITPNTIITNQHVVRSAGDTVSITVNGQGCKAKVGYREETWDLAVLTTDCTSTPLGITKQNPKVGTTAFIAGYPGMFGLQHAKGMVSGEWNSYMILDMDVNQGSSGGPVVNLLGQVIGVVAANGKDTQGIGAALSAEDVHKFINRAGVSLQ